MTRLVLFVLAYSMSKEGEASENYKMTNPCPRLSLDGFLTVRLNLTCVQRVTKILS